MYVITLSIYILKIMTIRQHVLELFSSKVWKETDACSSKETDRGPKLTALTLCSEGPSRAFYMRFGWFRAIDIGDCEKLDLTILFSFFLTAQRDR